MLCDLHLDVQGGKGAAVHTRIRKGLDLPALPRIGEHFSTPTLNGLGLDAEVTDLTWFVSERGAGTPVVLLECQLAQQGDRVASVLAGLESEGWSTA